MTYEQQINKNSTNGKKLLGKRPKLVKEYAVIKKLLFIFILSSLIGCGPFHMRKDANKKFTYDYVSEGKSKTELWKAARNYFAGGYGDSRAVLRVVDQEEGAIIGKALISWRLERTFLTCLSKYNIRFAAKEGKARLQLELLHGVPPLSECNWWAWPSREGYVQIVKDFDATSAGLEAALKGIDPSSDFNDF